MLDSFYIPEINPNISPTIIDRLRNLTTIASALIFTYALNFENKKHHKVSLIIISICVFLTIIIEIIFRNEKAVLNRFLYSLFLVCLLTIGDSFNNCIEKYLVDYNYINPFKILMFEGIFELIFAILVSIGKEPFKDIIYLYETNTTGNFVLLIVLLFFYFLLTILVNAYKIYCNVIYSPMARTLIDYLMNPFFIIYYFFTGKDFNNNYLYFIISEIISIVEDLFGGIYNEYIILFLCGMEYETKDMITKRALSLENMTLLNTKEDDECDKEINDNDSNHDNKNKDIKNEDKISFGNYEIDL